MKKMILTLAVGALVAVAAGCGGGGGGGTPLTKDEFITQADAICKDANDAVGEIEFGNVDPTSAQATEADLDKFGDALEKGISIFRGQVSKLRDLTPPEDFQKSFSGALDDVETNLDKLGEAADAAHGGDKETMKSKLTEAETYSNRADKVAMDYGLKECGKG